MLTPRWLYESPGRRLAFVSFDWALTNRNAGQGNSWRDTHGQRKALDFLVKSKAHTLPRFHDPVVLVVCRVLGVGKRLWDHDSIGRGNAKQLIDAIVAAGVLQNDTPEFVRHVAYCQDSVSRSRTVEKQPRIEVQFWSGDSYDELDV